MFRDNISRFCIEFEWDVQKIINYLKVTSFMMTCIKFYDILGSIDFFGKNLMLTKEKKSFSENDIHTTVTTMA